MKTERSTSSPWQMGTMRSRWSNASVGVLGCPACMTALAAAERSMSLSSSPAPSRIPLRVCTHRSHQVLAELAKMTSRNHCHLTCLQALADRQLRTCRSEIDRVFFVAVYLQCFAIAMFRICSSRLFLLGMSDLGKYYVLGL